MNLRKSLDSLLGYVSCRNIISEGRERREDIRDNWDLEHKSLKLARTYAYETFRFLARAAPYVCGGLYISGEVSDKSYFLNTLFTILISSDFFCSQWYKEDREIRKSFKKIISISAESVNKLEEGIMGHLSEPCSKDRSEDN